MVKICIKFTQLNNILKHKYIFAWQYLNSAGSVLNYVWACLLGEISPLKKIL